MKKEYDESEEVKLIHVEKPLASALSLDDLQGVFYLSGLLICVGFIVFLFECLLHGPSTTNKNTKIIRVKEHKN